MVGIVQQVQQLIKVLPVLYSILLCTYLGNYIAHLHLVFGHDSIYYQNVLCSFLIESNYIVCFITLSWNLLFSATVADTVADQFP